jgi:Tannase and feruloyl esterase
MQKRAYLLSSAWGLVLALGYVPVYAAPAVGAPAQSTLAPPQVTPTPAQAKCSASLNVAWPDRSTHIERVAALPATATLPAHCDVYGVMHERVGVDGQHYAIHFHMRLPDAWNGKFFFQGGGGSNGELGDALGHLATGPAAAASPMALAKGYAVVSQDSGHSNGVNDNPKRGGRTAFGFDPQARADYGHASLAPIALAAKALLAAYYDKAPTYSYFYGCSKGGEEGMVLAQQHPDLFNGIVANAPGFALPKAALEQTAEVQLLAKLAEPKATHFHYSAFAQALSMQDMGLVKQAVLTACDGLDGAKDGMVSNYAQCTAARVVPYLQRLQCAATLKASCLAPAKLQAVQALMAGGRVHGKPLYASWPWDAGVADMGWRIWKLGSPDGRTPSLNVVLGGASLNTVFTSPPREVPADPQGLLDVQMAFNMAKDSAKIHARVAPFTNTPWEDNAAHSSDLSGFKAHGGKLLVAHGLSDPVFSANDTMRWYDAVNAREKGKAAAFVRLFPVPGMAHCSGGAATTQFDMLSALENWVEHGKAPESLAAKADASTPFPGRTRPLCAYPKYAQYNGTGSLEEAANFTCVSPQKPRRG